MTYATLCVAVATLAIAFATLILVAVKLGFDIGKRGQ